MICPLRPWASKSLNDRMSAALQPLILAARAALAPSSTIRDLLAVTQQPGMRSLGGGLPAEASFPVERIRAAVDCVLSRPALMVDALQYGPTDGLPSLRATIAASTALHGLTEVDPDDLVVTTGSQQALDLLCRTMLDPGDEIGVDDPCYLGARQVFLAGGARLRGIPVDADGMRTDVLGDWLRAGWRPRLVYTVANFQNPTGATLSAERRVELVALAQQFGFLIVDDDPYHALDFSDGEASLVALGNLDAHHVASLGSLSKMLSPGIRLGWVRAPKWLRDALIRAKQACDLHAPSFSQAIANEVLADTPFMIDHIARNQSLYAARARALVGAVAPIGAVVPPKGGMFAWIHINGVDTDALLERAIVERVAFIPGSAFAVDQQWSEHARLSFATLSEEDLYAAVASLKDAILAL